MNSAEVKSILWWLFFPFSFRMSSMVRSPLIVKSPANPNTWGKDTRSSKTVKVPGMLTSPKTETLKLRTLILTVGLLTYGLRAFWISFAKLCVFWLEALMFQIIGRLMLPSLPTTYPSIARFWTCPCWIFKDDCLWKTMTLYGFKALIWMSKMSPGWMSIKLKVFSMLVSNSNSLSVSWK